ncbi:hypothetical protein DTO169E5_7274 [Paecilomyces variotii]|nr:hypothetical protein DTO169E5_7274 [Paecilomyces variotii]
MTTFSQQTFGHAAYATFRPTYPDSLYERVLSYHGGGHDVLVDLGTGHGLVARSLCGAFTKVYGVDQSAGMIEQARQKTPVSTNIEYRQASAESLPFLEDGSVDLVVAGQAAHWFNYPPLFEELRRVVRPGGSIAFWGYKDPVFPGHPEATAILHHYSYGDHPDLLGPYWSYGRAIIQDNLHAMQPPDEDWTDIQRVEYEPGLSAPGTGKGTMLMTKTLALEQVLGYIRTYSAFHGWQQAHPERKAKGDGGAGDVMDECAEKMVAADESWRRSADWRREEVIVEWGTALVMARRSSM